MIRRLTQRQILLMIIHHPAVFLTTQDDGTTLGQRLRRWPNAVPRSCACRSGSSMFPTR